MKQVGIFLVILISVVTMSVMAQTTDSDKLPEGREASPSQDGETPSEQPVETSGQTPNVERRYPVAAGVWYPGEPVPTVPSRYYRIRCWPGCHSSGEYADPKNIENASEKKTDGSY